MPNPQIPARQLENQQQYTSQAPPVMTTPSTALPGMGINQQQGVIVDQQHLKGSTGAEQGVNARSQILKSSSAGGPTDVQVENSVVQTSSVGAVGASQKAGTTKVCRRCVV